MSDVILPYVLKSQCGCYGLEDNDGIGKERKRPRTGLLH